MPALMSKLSFIFNVSYVFNDNFCYYAIAIDLFSAVNGNCLQLVKLLKKFYLSNLSNTMSYCVNLKIFAMLTNLF